MNFDLIFENLTKISPAIFWAGLILLLGILISKLAERIIKNFLIKIRIDQVAKRVGFQEAFEKIGISFEVSDFISQIVKWFFIILFLMVSVEILGLNQFSQFLEKIIDYFSNIFIAILIFLFALYLRDFSEKVFIGTLEKEKITYSKFLNKGISFSIWILAGLAILYQLRIVPNLILAIFIGIIAIIVLALGISLGLGGKDLAAKILKELEEKFK